MIVYMSRINLRYKYRLFFFFARYLAVLCIFLITVYQFRNDKGSINLFQGDGNVESGLFEKYYNPLEVQDFEDYR